MDLSEVSEVDTQGFLLFKFYDVLMSEINSKQ